MEFWKNILNLLKNGETLVLLYVIKSEGSSPGRQGFRMSVSSSGKMDGSIGGGFMEHKLIELSKNMLSEGEFKPFIKKQIHQTNIENDKSGMICSGEQIITFYYLDKSTLKLIKSILNKDYSTLEMTNKGLFINDKEPELLNNENVWRYSERLYHQPKLYIIGAGHVGLALSKMMKQLGFHITLLDNRKNLNTFDSNVFVDEKRIVDYNEISTYIPEGKDVYVVLASFSFRMDEICIRELVKCNFKYFGVMGSQSKMDKLFENLESEGIAKSDLDRIHSPIGVKINSKTPEEIAISIAAEIISVKNSN